MSSLIVIEAQEAVRLTAACMSNTSPAADVPYLPKLPAPRHFIGSQRVNIQAATTLRNFTCLAAMLCLLIFSALQLARVPLRNG
jgi:hypothetical protein